jgi:hypothetical protein
VRLVNVGEAEVPPADTCDRAMQGYGGLVGELDEDGFRSLSIYFELPGMYAVCHAFVTPPSIDEEAAEATERFTLQPTRVHVRYAITAVVPYFAQVNKLVTLTLEGPAPGDHVRLMEWKPARGISCAGAAASADGGRVSTAGTLQVRITAQLLVKAAPFTVCHAFNRTDDGDPPEEDYLPQGALNVSVAYPVQAADALDVNEQPTAIRVRKRLLFDFPTGSLNSLSVGDAVVLLPASVGDCRGAADLHKDAECNGVSGDRVAAGSVMPSADDGSTRINRALRLYEGPHVVCVAFADDLYKVEGDDDDDDDDFATQPNPPPPAPPPGVTCVREEDYAATDDLFREQFGVRIDVRWPLLEAPRYRAQVEQDARAELEGAEPGDMVRLLPACEEGCGAVAGNGKLLPGSAHPDWIEVGTQGSNISMGGYAPAVYKVCYAYHEDLDGGAPSWRGPSAMALAVDVPTSTASVQLYDPAAAAGPPGSAAAPVVLPVADGEVYAGGLAADAWAWFQVPLECSAAAAVTGGCDDGEPLVASLEFDAAFSMTRVRYDSLELLASVAAVAGDAVADAAHCFDGLPLPLLHDLQAGYFAPGARLHDSGHELRVASDRATLNVGFNSSAWSCGLNKRAQLFVRLRCAPDAAAFEAEEDPAAALHAARAAGCNYTLRATLWSARIRAGTDTTRRLPIEPGGEGGDARQLIQAELEDADILRFTLRSAWVACDGGFEELPWPSHAALGFGGIMLAQMGACPSPEPGGFADVPGGALQRFDGCDTYGCDAPTTAAPTGSSDNKPASPPPPMSPPSAPPLPAPRNGTVEFFCVAQAELVTFVIDAATQTADTEGPAELAPLGAPFAENRCPGHWITARDKLSFGGAGDMPAEFVEGGARNVRRRPRIYVDVDVYRSEGRLLMPFEDGEARVACLALGQLRRYSITTGGAHNSTLHVAVNAPISGIYASRNALPTPEEHDVAATLAGTPRWGCDDPSCAMRSTFSLVATTCAPDEPAIWHVALFLDDADDAADAAADAARHGSEVSLRARRFEVMLELQPIDAVIAYSPPPPPNASDPYDGVPVPLQPPLLDLPKPATRHSYLCCSAFRHVRLLAVPSLFAPAVQIEMGHGTLRAIYLQPDVCATSATGLSPEGTSESSACAHGSDGCIAEWMTTYNPYTQRRVYRSTGALTMPPLSAKDAAGAPPRDWWLSLEANEDDLAEVEISMQLLEAVPISPPPCQGMYCVDPDDPATRHRSTPPSPPGVPDLVSEAKAPRHESIAQPAASLPSPCDAPPDRALAPLADAAAARPRCARRPRRLLSPRRSRFAQHSRRPRQVLDAASVGGIVSGVLILACACCCYGSYRWLFPRGVMEPPPGQRTAATSSTRDAGRRALVDPRAARDPPPNPHLPPLSQRPPPRIPQKPVRPKHQSHFV